jgi:SPP1 gp7 family putative phage head morphogenesis protein
MKSKAGPVSDAERRQARQQEQDRAELEHRGVAAGARVGWRTQQAAIAAYRKGQDPVAAIRKTLRLAIPLVAEAMVTAHLTGIRRSILACRQAGSLALSSTPYDGAVKALADRLDAKIDRLDVLRRVYQAEAVKVLSRVSDATIEKIETFQEKMERAIAEKLAEKGIHEAAERGEHVRGGIQAMRDAFNAAGLTPDNSYTLENLFRTQIQTAYAAGRWQQDQDPAVQEILWGYKYVTVGDDRVRPEHQALDGTTLPKDDPQWRSIWPPNGYSCRCTAISIFEERKAVYPPAVAEIDGKAVVPGPDPGFANNAGEIAEGILPSPVEITEKYRDAETVDEAEKWARKLALELDYSGLSVESANQVNRALASFSKGLRGKLSLDQVVTESAEGRVAGISGNSLILNPDEMKSPAIRERQIGIDNRFVRRRKAEGKTVAERWAVSRGISGDVCHEIGHVALNRAMEAGLSESEVFQALQADAANVIGGVTPLKPKEIEIAQQISDLAAKNSDQYFSEAWTSYHLEGKNRFPRRVRELIERVKSLVESQP